MKQPVLISVVYSIFIFNTFYSKVSAADGFINSNIVSLQLQKRATVADLPSHSAAHFNKRSYAYHAARSQKRYDEIALANAKLDSDQGKPKSSITTTASFDKILKKRAMSEKALNAIQNDTVTKANPTTFEHTLGLDIEGNDIGYFTTIMIGTPPRPYKVLLDTGSADFWVPSVHCNNCGSHARLGLSNSSSLKPTNKSFSIMYGSGMLEGKMVKDDVTIAGLKLHDLEFGAALGESSQFNGDSIPFDGLMGLALSYLSRQGVMTPIDTLYARKLVSEPQMGFALGRVVDPSNSGTVTFGGVDTTKFSGNLLELPVIGKSGFWQTGMDDVSVNGKLLNFKNRTAIFDTGTSLLIVPQEDAVAIHKAIPGALAAPGGTFAIPCDTNVTISLMFQGQAFPIKMSDLLFEPLESSSAKDLCISSISGSTNSVDGIPNAYLLGDTFLKNIYFATDTSRLVVGIARRQSNKK